MAEELEKEWREQLERLGTAQVRAILANPNATGRGDGASFTYIHAGKGPKGHPSRGFVQEWLSEKERSESRRSKVLYRLAWTAAVASVLSLAVGLLSLFVSGG